MHAAIAFSDVHSFRSHPCSAGCLCVSIRHVAIAQRWRQRPVLHWVAPPLPPSSGCESEAWIRHPRLPTHYFLSGIEDERRWWLRARCFGPCEWFVGEQLCVRGVIGKAEMWARLKMFCSPGLTEPRRMTYPFFSGFQSFYIQLPTFLSTHICWKDLLFYFTPAHCSQLP